MKKTELKLYNQLLKLSRKDIIALSGFKNMKELYALSGFKNKVSRKHLAKATAIRLTNADS